MSLPPKPRLILVGALFTGILVLLTPELIRNLVMRAPPGEPEKVLAASTQDRPKKPGSIVVAPARDGSPLLVQAIVYDFDHTPPGWMWNSVCS